MCRLFALNASPKRIRATFWLLNASENFVNRSHANPDGTGLGYFDELGVPIVDNEPLPAYEDQAFLREAKQISSIALISHIRFATAGASTLENCHPFAMDDRLFAHHGALGGIDRLEARLEDVLAEVKGQTDSERFFALITKEIRAHRDDVPAGIAAAVRWIAQSIPVSSLNFVLATPHELWAFRYPETDELYVLERAPGGQSGGRELHYITEHLRVRSPQLVDNPAVIVASERLDDNADWRLMRSGELIHVARDRTVASKILIDRAPAQTLEPSEASASSVHAA